MSTGPEVPLADQLKALVRLTGDVQQPNINALWQIAKDIEGIKLNIKAFGYELARQLAEVKPARIVDHPSIVGLTSKPSTQADMESDWVAYWAGKLGMAVIYHRKIWEHCFLLQALHEHTLLREGARGLGFGCGQEPIPSFLAALGCRVSMTDLDPSLARGMGWMETGQHTSSVEMGFHAHLVSRATFQERVELIYVDMNAIPATLTGYDFCWSLCSLEHLGSIDRGLDFIENSLATLRPGGVAVHTTEFNYLNDNETIDNWATVLFQRKHFEALTARLTAKGHRVAPLDFDVGNGPMDRFIDLPPYAHDHTGKLAKWAEQGPHLKLLLDGFAATCFGMIIVKSEQPEV